MLTTTSAFRAASAGESATDPMPRASALLFVRSQTETSKPPFFNRRAIAPPIFPVPSTATFVIGASPVLVLNPLPVDPGHVRIAFPLWSLDRAQTRDLIERQSDSGGGGILLHTKDMLCPRDRHDVVSLREQPCKRHLGRRRPNFRRDHFHGVHNAEVLLKVAIG